LRRSHVKLGQLRVADLDIILCTNNIPVVGNKQAKIDELTRILDCDEIERNDYDFDANTAVAVDDQLIPNGSGLKCSTRKCDFGAS